MLLPRSGNAQDFPGYVLHGIDSALGAIYMNRSDITMRWDSYPDDPHRLSVIKGLFGDPLASFNVADSIAGVSFAISDRPEYPFPYFGSLLDLGSDFNHITRPVSTDADIKLNAKIDLDTLDFPSAIILRKFLSLAVATDIQVLANRSIMTGDRLQRLVAYCDSLVIQSEEDANATLVEMKAAERYGMDRSKQFFNVDAAGLDYGKLLKPGMLLYVNALEMARNMETELPRYRDSIRTRIWNTPMGRVAIGGPGDDLYEGEFFCVIDVGGNDVYRAAPRTKEEVTDRGTSLIVDFGGNDTYIGGDYAFGGTLFGASTLIDMHGDDSYTARNFSLGCGFFGTGVLYDAEGSDRYSAGTCSEGAGLFGIGLIVDAKGNDNYLAHLESQGFGFTRGLGAIIELGGNDSYIAASPYTDFLRYDDHFETFCQGAALGSRPVASGGIGIIADSAGSDTYVADIFGQGTGYWYGLGAIVDRRGNDSYNAFQYSQGAGVHLAFGVLHDAAGNDNYVSHGVSQGCGHDIGFGGLYDSQGDDNYVVESLSLGAGNADGISLFVDGGGEDGYIARRTNTLGYSDLRRDYGMIGIFLDLDGTDFYGTSRGANDSLWTGSSYGAGLDANLRPKEKQSASTGSEQEKTKEQIEKELGADIPTLFTQASAAPQKYQYIVEPARNRLLDRADSSIPYLLSQLNSESARERLALGILLPRLGKRVAQQLIDTVRHGDSSRVTQAIYALGEMHESAAAVALGEKLVDSANWNFRASAGEALLKMNASSAKDYLKRALTDTVEIVRARAARALAAVADSGELARYVLPMLDDRSQLVRYQIQLGLQRRGPDSVASFLGGTLASEHSRYAGALLTPLAHNVQGERARQRILDIMFRSRSAEARAEGVRLALAWNDTASIERAAKLRQREKSSVVLSELERLPSIEPERQSDGSRSTAGSDEERPRTRKKHSQSKNNDRKNTKESKSKKEIKSKKETKKKKHGR
jgi:hypothetical protein